jgi:hypothetical protein
MAALVTGATPPLVEPSEDRWLPTPQALCYPPRVSYLRSFEYASSVSAKKTKERYPASIPGRAPCFVAGMISSHASVVGRVIYCVFESAYPRGTIPELVRRSTQLPRMSCLDHVLTPGSFATPVARWVSVWASESLLWTLSARLSRAPEACQHRTQPRKRVTFCQGWE